uniref:Exportin-2 n=1 Tax=Macrostomum lignano TaxID=282301 RepID=A0A1I8G889_9PLAT
MEAIVKHIENTVSPDPAVRKPSEQHLQSSACQPGFPLSLLHIVCQPNLSSTVRLSAAVLLKNSVKQHWRDDEAADTSIAHDDRERLKVELVDAMLSSPAALQNQLSDVIALIGRADFPDRWPGLIGQLVARFSSGDFHAINGVLKTAHSLFRRYRYESRSDRLWLEIKYVLQNFAQPLTDLFLAAMDYAAAQASASNKDGLQTVCGCLLLICKIFYSLNYQDIPEFFEDNMPKWMPRLRELLQLRSPLLESADPDEAGILEQIGSQICEIVSLYACKYDEEFAPYLPDFVKDVWSLLLATGPQSKYDLLVSNAIKFLASVAERPQNKQLFGEPETLRQLCERIVIPNMHLRPSDEELFHYNAEEYIRRDMEGSDQDTRRRAACDLVRALCKSFEGPVIGHFSQYVQHLLQEYSANRQSAWRSKDAALYLVTSLAAKAQTSRHGVTQATELVNMAEFCRTQALPELQESGVDTLPVVRAACLKFLVTFRSQLPPDMIIGALPLAVAHLAAESPVCHSYAAAFLENAQTVRNAGALVVTSENMPEPQALFQGLFGLLSRAGSEENDYAMKRNLYYALRQPPSLQNPSKPLFNHYLFESLCLCVTTACQADSSSAAQFEAALFPLFQDILQRDVTDFLPYTFQVLAVLLEQHRDGPSEPYWALFPFLLAPVLWESPANVPALARLLRAFVRSAGQSLTEARVSSVLGVFQKLLESKAHDHHAFALLCQLVVSLPDALMEKYTRPVLMLVFQRLMRTRTVKYVKQLLVFLAAYALAKGADRLVAAVDGVQAGMFAMVVESLVLADMQKVDAGADRRVCSLGFSRVLTECPGAMLSTYAAQWPKLLTALVALIELPQAEVGEEDQLAGAFASDGPAGDHAGGIGSGAASYNQLVFAGKPATVDLSLISGGAAGGTDAKSGLARGLRDLSMRAPGQLQPLIRQADPQAQQYLQQYLSANNVQLA